MKMAGRCARTRGRKADPRRPHEAGAPAHRAQNQLGLGLSPLEDLAARVVFFMICSSSEP